MSMQEIFSATLKRERMNRGMSMREFSDEIGIALSSLQEYEAGRRIPRGDTIAQIAEKLHTSPAALVSDLPAANLSLRDPLIELSRKIQSLHPYARVSAQHALDLLLLAFRTSDDLFFQEAHSAPPPNPSARFRYILYESNSLLFPSPAYGILVEELLDDGWSTTANFAPFSNDRLAVLNICFSANDLQLPPAQFFSDFFPRFYTPRP